MHALWQILDPACIELDLKARRKDEALSEMVDLLVRAGKVRGGAVVLDAVRAREKLVSTAIGEGVAIPHCESPEIDSTILAFARTHRGLAFDAPDRRPVRLLFFLVGPGGHEHTHLRLLSRLARLLRDPVFPAGLLAATSPAQVLELLRRAERGNP